MAQKRRRHSSKFKFKVALEAARGGKTISQLSSEYQVHATQIGNWKRELLQKGPGIFSQQEQRKEQQENGQEAELYEQIGRLKMELEWLKKKAAEVD